MNQRGGLEVQEFIFRTARSEVVKAYVVRWRADSEFSWPTNNIEVIVALPVVCYKIIGGPLQYKDQCSGRRLKDKYL